MSPSRRPFSGTSWGVFGILLIPTSVFMFLQTSSMTSGLLLAQLAWVLAIAWTHRGMLHFGARRGELLAAALAILVIALQSVAAGSLYSSLDLPRLLGSLVIVAGAYLSASCVATALRRVSERELVRVMSIALKLMVAMALLAIAGAPALGPGYFEKPVILFTEKSHFALAFAPLFLFGVAVRQRRARWWLLGVGAAVSLALQSTTGVVALLLVAFLVLSPRNILLFGAAAACAVLFLNTSYYTSRLDFSGDSDNLSALVFLSGWERAVLNLQETWGLGVGFQQFGIVGSLGELMTLIELKASASLNLNDGGSCAAKLVGELGLVGVVVLAAYVAVFSRALLQLRRFARRPAPDVHGAFWNAYIVAASLDIFVRGQGYFSVGMYMLLVALLGKYRRVRAAPARTRPILSETRGDIALDAST